MSTITNTVQEKWDAHSEEEETLSLCDLPINREDQPKKQDTNLDEKQEEFNFHSWHGLFSQEPEMCIADEVFFQGQILPLRHSFSSEAGLLTTGFHHDGKKFNRGKSSSESLDLDHSSRSSSLRSQNSSSTSSSTNSTTPITSKPKIRNRNQFHTYPSPKPQLKLPIPKQTSFGNQTRKSSLWEIFRLGVVPTPEIGLQDLKVRNKNCVSRNSSSSSSNNSGKTNNHFFKQFVGKGGGLLSGCDCSIETVMIKGGTKSTNMTESTTAHAVNSKLSF